MSLISKIGPHMPILMICITITHAIIRPEMCLCCDEVGGNTCMAGDGHVGGDLFLAETGTIQQNKTSKTNKRYTLIVITAFTCELVICIIISQGKQPKADIKAGVDILVPPIGDSIVILISLPTIRPLESICHVVQYDILMAKKSLPWSDGTILDQLRPKFLLTRWMRWMILRFFTWWWGVPLFTTLWAFKSTTTTIFKVHQHSWRSLCYLHRDSIWNSPMAGGRFKRTKRLF